MPSWFYGPNDQAGIFDACPKGWADHPRLVDPHGVPSEDALVEAAKAFDHDGDGKPGGSRRKKAVSRESR